MKIQFAEVTAAKAKPDAVMVFLVGEDKKLGALAASMDKQSGGLLSAALSGGKFTGKRGQFTSVIMPKAAKTGRVVLAGIGTAKTMDAKALANLGGAVAAQVNGLGAKSATLVLEDVKGLAVSSGVAAAHIAHGANLRSYRFDKYHTKKGSDEKPTLASFTVAVTGAKAAAAPYASLEKVAEGVFLTRNLVNHLPRNHGGRM
jgi:leucyl aminopeptidase